MSCNILKNPPTNNDDDKEDNENENDNQYLRNIRFQPKKFGYYTFKGGKKKKEKKKLTGTGTI